jgi:hypothetical protein
MGWRGTVSLAGSYVINWIRFAAQASSPSYQQGNLYWDDDDKTLALQTDTSEVTLQIGQELQVRVVNKTGAQIDNGMPCYISGQSGSRATIAKASSAADNAASHCVGIATHDIADNETGYITAFGLVRDVATDSYSAGDLLYLQDTAGTLGTSPGTVDREIGQVVVSHATEGIMIVNIHHT